MKIDRSRIGLALLILSLISGLQLPIMAPTAQANGTAQSIALEATPPTVVTLGALASRSQSKPLTKTGSTSPYTMSGTDSRTNQPYEYQTDFNYSGVQLKESDERTGSLTFTRTVATVDARPNVVRLSSTGSVVNLNATRGSYGAAFGPQVWSAPFAATTGQSISFEWKAEGGGDHYEVYGFLVKYSGTADCTTANTATSDAVSSADAHSILTYGRGRLGSWSTTSGAIASDGCYRFRFVSGSYDATGGLVLGATFFIYNIQLGLTQTLNFTQPDDFIRSGSSQTQSLTVTSNADGANITITSLTPNVCTASSNPQQVTVLANASGTCTLRASSSSVGAYAPASSVTRSLLIRTSAVAPIYSGGVAVLDSNNNIVSGTIQTCATLTAREGTWLTGGSAITATAVQWMRSGVNIIGATGPTYTVTSADDGQLISFSVSQTNGKGTTKVNSASYLVTDTSLSALSISDPTTVIDPEFNSCANSYTADVSVSNIRITPTAASSTATLKINNVSALSGSRSNLISLSGGSVNTITITITNGGVSRNVTLGVTYNRAPIVQVLAPVSLDATNATIDVSINLNGLAASGDALVQLSSSDAFDPAEFSTDVLVSADAAVKRVAFTGLSQGVYYYVKATVANTFGLTVSNTIRFMLPQAPFVVSSDAIQQANTSDVKINYSIIPNGDPAKTTDVFLELSTDVNSFSTSSFAGTPTLIVTGAHGTAEVTSDTLVGGLSVGSTYYYRIKVTNFYGTNYGSLLSFTVTAPPTLAITGAVTTDTTAVLSGTVNPNAANVTKVFFTYSTDDTFPAGAATITTDAIPSTLVGNSPDNVQLTVTGLTPGTQYFYYLTAENSRGVTSSDVQVFTTDVDGQPTAQISTPSNAQLATPISITIIFSEVVTGFESSDLTLSSGTGTWTRSAAQSFAGGRIYTVELTPGANAAVGTLDVSIAADAAQDLTNKGNLPATFSIQILVGTPASAPIISYTPNVIRLLTGDPFPELVPTDAGGTVESWTSVQPLPSGLTLNPTTGVITGQIFQVTAGSYTITATNSVGSATTTILIIVNDRGGGIGPTIIPPQTQPQPDVVTNPQVPINPFAPSNRVNGSFTRPINSVTVNGSVVPTTQWKQESTSFELQTKELPPGSYTVQIDNGSSSPLTYTFVKPAPIEVVPVPKAPAEITNISKVLENGEETRVTTTPNTTSSGFQIKGDIWDLNLSVRDQSNAAVAALRENQVVLQPFMKVFSAGTGFMPFSTVRIFMFSEPVQIGTATVKPDGTFETFSDLPNGISLGQHLLQVAGVSPENTTRTATIKVLIEQQVNTLTIGFSRLQRNMTQTYLDSLKSIFNEPVKKIVLKAYAKPKEPNFDRKNAARRATTTTKAIREINAQVQIKVKNKGGSAIEPLCVDFKNRCVVVQVRR